jgi:hypothetical protein
LLTPETGAWHVEKHVADGDHVVGEHVGAAVSARAYMLAIVAVSGFSRRYRLSIR